MSQVNKIFNRLTSYLAMITIVAFGIISALGTGGSDNGGGVAPVTYTGLETQAQITSDNAQPLGEIAFLGVTAGSFVSIAVDQQVPLDESRSTSVITIARALHTVLIDINANEDVRLSPIGWIETQPPIPGQCGGTASGSTDVNESDQTFSGSIAFSNWCNFGFTMNGTVTFSGECDAATFDPATQACDIIDYTMVFITFTASGDGYSETMTGTLATTITPTGYVSTLNLMLRLDNENVTFKFEDYVSTVIVNSPTDYDTVVVAGNVYHPDFGFVVVTTPTPVQFYTDSLDGPPLSGVVLLTGANGTAGLTTATYTFIDFNFFEIAVDTDGDGSADITWSCDWDPGDCTI